MKVKTQNDNQAEVFDYSAESPKNPDGRFFVVNYRLEYGSCQKRYLFEARLDLGGVIY